MNDPHRYPVFGDLLHVDLSDRSCTRGPVPESSVECLLGGRGFNVGYLYDHLPTGIDPFGAGQPAGFFLRAVNRFPGAHGIASSHQRPVPAYRLDRKFQCGRLRGCLAQIHRNREPGGEGVFVDSGLPVHLG
jgi:hypothetical protein